MAAVPTRGPRLGKQPCRIAALWPQLQRFLAEGDDATGQLRALRRVRRRAAVVKRRGNTYQDIALLRTTRHQPIQAGEAARSLAGGEFGAGDEDLERRIGRVERGGIAERLQGG